jgi:hypothetical protein
VDGRVVSSDVVCALPKHYRFYPNNVSCSNREKYCIMA